MDRIVPEEGKGEGRGGRGLYRHAAEGPDDMPVCLRMSTLHCFNI